MNAQDLVQAVAIAENDLLVDFAEVINKKLASLSNETGLEFGGVTFNTTGTITMGDHREQCQVTSVTIDYSLPDKINRRYI